MSILSEFDDLSTRIEYSYDQITHISAQKGIGPPTTVIMNLSFFHKWLYYCEEKGLDHMRWKGKQIIVDTSSPVEVCFSYHIEQNIMRKMK